jgi:hypothetical protein
MAEGRGEQSHIIDGEEGAKNGGIVCLGLFNPFRIGRGDLSWEGMAGEEADIPCFIGKGGLAMEDLALIEVGRFGKAVDGEVVANEADWLDEKPRLF